jgi:PAS domain S-box-containing protein
MRAVFDSAQDTISVIGPDERFTEANQAFCDMLGLTREQVVGASLQELFGPEEVHIQRSANTLAQEAGQPVHFERRYSLPQARTADTAAARREVWFSVVKTAVRDEAGNFLGVLGMGRDVTTQKQSELALRESERRFSSLLRQLPVGVFETDTAGRLLFANERMQRQTGKSQEDLSGEGWMSCIHPDDRAGFLVKWRVAIMEGKKFTGEVRLRKAHGAVFWTLCQLRPLRDTQHGASGFLGTFIDVTERKQAEILREEVENVVRHDLKSPLGAMLSAVDLLNLLGGLNAEQGQVLVEMRLLVKRMLGLITLSLDMATMESGLYVPALTVLDLHEVLADMARELRPLLIAKMQRLEITPSPESGPFLVLGERRLLDAVFSNLMKNAAEAAPEGSAIQVRLWVDTRQGSSLAMASMRNQGEVPEAIRRVFFDKFITSGKAGGTGLGTYSARLMVRTLGGTLALDTTEPGHTTLTVRLPHPGAAASTGAASGGK